MSQISFVVAKLHIVIKLSKVDYQNKMLPINRPTKLSLHRHLNLSEIFQHRVKSSVLSQISLCPIKSH